MNFLDTYDISNATQSSRQPSGTDTPNDAQPQASLHDEVNQVVSQLSRFWGGFRKQSQSALEAARKDFGQVVEQAQRELNKLTSDSPSAAAPSTSTRESSTSTGTQRQLSEDTSGAEASSSPLPPEGTPTPASSSLLSRLQAALPPNLVSTVQQNIPETLRHATENIDVNQIQAKLLAEFQRVQGVTRAQAEEYVNKSEALIREAMKEAGEALRDAVKVIPPEDAHAGSSSQPMMWDGTDVWMLPSDPAYDDGSSPQAGESERASTDTPRGVATRAEMLYKRLIHDPAIVRFDPSVDGAVGEQYKKWYSERVEADGGINSEVWERKISKTLADGDGEALKKTMDTLVPEKMNASTFWSRFFFRVHQIEVEEEKRKALLQGTMENEDDFSWEDEEEDSDTNQTLSTKTTTKPSALVNAREAVPAQSSLTRESSEDSYDNISSEEDEDGGSSDEETDSDKKRSTAPTAPLTTTASTANTSTPKKTDPTKDNKDDDSDSDWE